MTILRRGEYRLTEKQAEALAMHERGMSAREMAEELGVSPECVWKRLRRARTIAHGARIVAETQAREERAE